MDIDEEKERQHVETIITVFQGYQKHALSANNRRRKDFFALPAAHQKLLPDYADLLTSIDDCILVNAKLLAEVVSEARSFLGFNFEHNTTNSLPISHEPTKSKSNPPDAHSVSSRPSGEADQERLWSTIRQIVRDWSEEGSVEREMCYGPILRAVDDLIAQNPVHNKSEYQVLVPGAGLGRLVFEICQRGVPCQGNECSLYMLIVSNWLLNQSTSTHQHTFYPWIHSLSNWLSSSAPLQAVSVPDVLPSSLKPGLMSMTAGDFVEVYSRPDQKRQWDCVITCFFIDTANNVIEYLSTIAHCLKSGGVWINLGPLLWHHENSYESTSLELSLEDLLGVAGRMGFKIENEEFIKTGYTTEPNAKMMRYEYTSAFFTAIRPSS